MLKNYKKQDLKFIILFTLGVLMLSPANAEPPEEMVLSFVNYGGYPDDVTHVKFECSLEGWLIENGERTSKAEVATGTVTTIKPDVAGIISVNFEPTVDDFELERSSDYICELYVRNAEDEEQGWVGVSAGSNTPDIGRVELGGSDGSLASTMMGGRAIKLKGSLIGSAR
jgi:hypothetical protein